MSVERRRSSFNNWVTKGGIAIGIAMALYAGAQFLDRDGGQKEPFLDSGTGYDPLDCRDINQSFDRVTLKEGEEFVISSLPIYLKDDKILTSGTEISGQIRDERRSPVREYNVNIIGKTVTDGDVEYRIAISGECRNN